MDARATSKGYKAAHNLRGLRVASRAHLCEGVAVSRARARCLPSESVAGATTARLRVGHAGAAPRSCEGVSRTPSSRGATPVPTEGTLKPARACGGRALYVVSRGARIASGVRRCPAPSCGAGAVRQSLCAQRRLAASVLPVQAASARSRGSRLPHEGVVRGCYISRLTPRRPGATSLSLSAVVGQRRSEAAPRPQRPRTSYGPPAYVVEAPGLRRVGPQIALQKR